MYLLMSAALWPKRLETIFTSSGWDTSLGIFFLVLDLVPIAVQNFWNVGGGQIVEKVVVDLDGRGPAACADALHFLEREDAVGRYAFVADAELFLKFLIDV